IRRWRELYDVPAVTDGLICLVHIGPPDVTRDIGTESRTAVVEIDNTVFFALITDPYGGRQRRRITGVPDRGVLVTFVVAVTFPRSGLGGRGLPVGKVHAVRLITAIDGWPYGRDDVGGVGRHVLVHDVVAFDRVLIGFPHDVA